MENRNPFCNVKTGMWMFGHFFLWEPFFIGLFWGSLAEREEQTLALWHFVEGVF